MKYNTRIESVSAEEFDAALNYCDNYIEAEPTSDSLISRNKYYWQDNRSNYHLVFKDYMDKRIVHLIFDPFTGEKDDTYEYKYRAGFKAFMALKSLAKKYDELDDINKFKDSIYAKDYSWIPYEQLDPYNTNKWVKAWEYDSNSNYLSKMKKPLPYGDIIRQNDYVDDGEIGFNIVANAKNGKKSLVTVFMGHADLIFKTKIYKSFSELADNMYAIKQTLSGEEKDKYKIKICALHGNMKNHNIFIATAIIGYSSEEIKMYNNMAHVYMNTVDSIICDRPIDAIPLGDGLGQFKVPHEGVLFKYRSHGIKEWATGEKKHKGQKKSRIGIEHQQYYILKGELYHVQNKE